MHGLINGSPCFFFGVFGGEEMIEHGIIKFI